MPSAPFQPDPTTDLTEAAKRLAGEYAADLVQDGMTIGLGTGSTAYWATRRLGTRVAAGLRVQAVATSKATAELASQLGIALRELGPVGRLDLVIDGADEVDPAFNLIKGGGGALLREKLVASCTDHLVIVVDDHKRVARLGRFPLPIEIVPFAWETTRARIEAVGGRARRREHEGRPFVTDNGNYILDTEWGSIDDPGALHRDLKLMVGVVETGLFVGMCRRLVVSDGRSVKSFLA
jgi:ribose 5-phosphate isomerase A